MINGFTEGEHQLIFDIVIEPLKKHGCKVWLFGSRARGDHKEFSDVDLLFQEPENKLAKGFVALIKSEIEDSNLPYKVDLVNRSEVAQSYRDNIENEKVAL